MPRRAPTSGVPASARSHGSSAPIAAIVPRFLYRMRLSTTTLPARRRLVSTLSCRTTPAILFDPSLGQTPSGLARNFAPGEIVSRSTSTRPNGARTPKPLFNPVVNWIYQSRWKYRARAMARTHGFSSRLQCRHAMPDVWVLPSSVTRAAVPGNSAWPRTTDFFQTRTPCRRAASAI